MPLGGGEPVGAVGEAEFLGDFGGVDGFIAVCIPDIDAHEGDLDAVDLVQGGGVDLAAADDPGVGKRGHRGDDVGAGGPLAGRAGGEHVILPAGKGTELGVEGLPSLPAHDDRRAHGHVLKVLEVFRHVPGHLLAIANDSIEGLCPDCAQH